MRDLTGGASALFGTSLTNLRAAPTSWARVTCALPRFASRRVVALRWASRRFTPRGPRCQGARRRSTRHRSPSRRNSLSLRCVSPKFAPTQVGDAEVNGAEVRQRKLGLRLGFCVNHTFQASTPCFGIGDLLFVGHCFARHYTMRGAIVAGACT